MQALHQSKTIFTVVISTALIIGLPITSCSGNSKAPGSSLTSGQASELTESIGIMTSHHLISQEKMANDLLNKGIWRAALPTDQYIADAEKAGDTPYAYTLSPGHKPIAIVLANRFFEEATPTGRAAVMIHEMGHYLAYVRSGKSTEYDGYKAEYDTYRQLGLSEADSLVYFSMLDGTAEYVVPKEPSLKHNADLQQFLN